MQLATLLLTTLVCSFSVGARAGQKEIAPVIKQMRDVALAVRVPALVCKKLPVDLPRLSGASQSVHQDILGQIKGGEISASQLAWAKKAVKTCVTDCQCQPLSEALGQFVNTPEIGALQGEADQAAEKMVDADFSNCQKRLKLTCATPQVRAVLNALKN